MVGRAGLWRVPGQGLLVRDESCPKPQAAPPAQPLLAEGPVAGSTLGQALSLAWWQPGAVAVLDAEVWGLCGPDHFTESHHVVKQRRRHSGLHGKRVRKTDSQAWCCHVHSEHRQPQITRDQQVSTLHLWETRSKGQWPSNPGLRQPDPLPPPKTQLWFLPE